MQGYQKLNGSKSKGGNFIWGAALTLAWKNLCNQIIKQPIRVKSDSSAVREIVDNFNKSSCNNNMLSSDCYYARAGFGNKTVNLINQQVQKKFPQKTTGKVPANLPDDGIISYAYFFKKLLFQNPFNKNQVYFNEKSVQGFVAKSYQQKKQVIVYSYENENEFLIELKTKVKKDHIYILKTQKNLTPEHVLQKIGGLKQSNDHLDNNDTFEMPNISLKHKRTVQQLVGVFLQNPKFSHYFFSQIYEAINFELDYLGVKVQNQGIVKLLRSMPMVERQFILDKPFWIVMRQQNYHPYFVAHINNLF